MAVLIRLNLFSRLDKLPKRNRILARGPLIKTSIPPCGPTAGGPDYSDHASELQTARALSVLDRFAHLPRMPRSIQRVLDQSPEVIPATELIDKRDGKPKRVPKKVQRAINLIFTGKCRFANDAAREVGLTPEHLCRMMRKAHVQVFIAQERARILSDGSMRAASRLVSLVDASSEHVSLDASKHVLAIQGVAPKQQGVSVDVNIRAGYVIRLGSSDAPGAGQARQADVAGQLEARVRVAGETNDGAGGE